MKEKASWCFFDFANSSFTTVVVSVVYSVYFTKTVVEHGSWNGVEALSLWNYVASFSQLLVMFTAPVIGAMADRAARKKKYLFRSYVVCVVATASLTFTGGGDVMLAALLFIVANVAFSTGENLVAGFLPELAKPEEMGRLSGYGWSIGYAGGLIALVIALQLVDRDLPEWTCMSTAIFFLLAGMPTFLFLKERAVPSEDAGRIPLLAGFRELRTTWSERHVFRDLFRFLFCVGFFQSGVAIVIINASPYGIDEIGMTKKEMVLLFIGLQISAGVGALIFGRVQDRIGSRATLAMTLLLWLSAVVVAWAAYDRVVYSVAGVLAGAAMGSSQSASRAFVGLLCPRGREAEWFGLWGLATKAAAVLGPLVFAVVTGVADQRTAILMTGIFFLLGLAMLATVNVTRGREAAATL